MIARGMNLDETIRLPLDLGQIADADHFDPLDWTFPTGPLLTSWRWLLTSSLIVGRSQWLARLQTDWTARYEAGRRVMQLLSHLRPMQFSSTDLGLIRTEIYRSEDGSEKVSSSYAIGMAVCQEFGAQYFGLPRLSHFDSVHNATGPRPDLVDPHHALEVFAEAKGRYRRLRAATMATAIHQLFAHQHAATMKVGFAVGSSFDTDGHRLSLHARTWNAYHAPLSWIRSYSENLRTDVPRIGYATVVGAHLMGASDESLSPDLLPFTTQVDGEEVICSRERQSGLILGLPLLAALEAFRDIQQESETTVDFNAERLLEEAAGRTNEDGLNYSGDLRLGRGVAIGWPDALRV